MDEIEDDLANLLKFASFGQQAAPAELLHAMFRSMELSMLKQVKTVIDARIKEVAKQEASVGEEALNPFIILGVTPDSTEEEVRQAYRDKAAKAHPDKGGTNDEMIKVNAAWETIRMFRGWKK